MQKTELCGQGTYSIVYRCENSATKMYRTFELIFGHANLVEIDILFRLSHPHLLPGIEITARGNVIFPYYRYVLNSPELRLLSFEEKKNLMIQLISAVDFLHQNGYLHLDIKANNILVNEDKSHLVLADFGGALFIGKQKTIVRRTYRLDSSFTSPELMKEKNAKNPDLTYSRQTDYWSLGIIILLFLNDETIDLKGKRKELFKEGKIWQTTTISDEEVIGWLKGLLAWKKKERKIPSFTSEDYTPIRIVERSYSFPPHILSEFVEAWSKLPGIKDDSIEVFFLAVDLYQRCHHLNFETPHNLFFLLYWMALKIISGNDIRITNVISSKVNLRHLLKLEVEIIKALQGELYPPNLYTSIQSENDLFSAWYKLLHPQSDVLTIRRHPKKEILSLQAYLAQIRNNISLI